MLDIIRCKTTEAEARRAYDLSPSVVENWVDEAKRGIENALQANPSDIHEQYERQLKQLKEAYGEAILELRARKSQLGRIPIGRGRQMIESIRQGTKADRYTVKFTKLCQWFGIPRRTMYDNLVKPVPKVNLTFASRSKRRLKNNRRLVIGQ